MHIDTIHYRKLNQGTTKHVRWQNKMYTKVFRNINNKGYNNVNMTAVLNNTKSHKDLFKNKTKEYAVEITNLINNVKNMQQF